MSKFQGTILNIRPCFTMLFLLLLLINVLSISGQTDPTHEDNQEQMNDESASESETKVKSLDDDEDWETISKGSENDNQDIIKEIIEKDWNTFMNMISKQKKIKTVYYQILSASLLHNGAMEMSEDKFQAIVSSLRTHNLINEDEIVGSDNWANFENEMKKLYEKYQINGMKIKIDHAFISLISSIIPDCENECNYNELIDALVHLLNESGDEENQVAQNTLLKALLLSSVIPVTEKVVKSKWPWINLKKYLLSLKKMKISTKWLAGGVAGAGAAAAAAGGGYAIWKNFFNKEPTIKSPYPGGVIKTTPWPKGKTVTVATKKEKKTTTLEPSMGTTESAILVFLSSLAVIVAIIAAYIWYRQKDGAATRTETINDTTSPPTRSISTRSTTKPNSVQKSRSSIQKNLSTSRKSQHSASSSNVSKPNQDPPLTRKASERPDKARSSQATSRTKSTCNSN